MVQTVHNPFKKIHFIATHAGFYSQWCRGYVPQIWRYWRKHCGRRPGDDARYVAYLDFNEEGGRALFNLAWVLHEGGCRILLRHRPVALSRLGPYGQWTLELPKLQLTKLAPEQVEADFYFSDTVKESGDRSNFIQVDFDYLRPLREGEYPIPIGVHPRHRRSGDFARYRVSARARNRPLRLFFAGNIRHPDYDGLTEVHGKMSRPVMIDHVSEEFADACVFPESTEQPWENYGKPIVIVDSGVCPLEGSEYFTGFLSSCFAL